MGLIGLLVVISLLKPPREGVEGYIEVLGNLGLGLDPLLNLQDGLVLCLESGFAFGSHCGIASNDCHPLLTLLKYCPLGQLRADVIQIPR